MDKSKFSNLTEEYKIMQSNLSQTSQSFNLKNIPKQLIEFLGTYIN